MNRFWRAARFWIPLGLGLTLLGLFLGYMFVAPWYDNHCNTDLVQNGTYMQRLFAPIHPDVREACREANAETEAEEEKEADSDAGADNGRPGDLPNRDGSAPPPPQESAQNEGDNDGATEASSNYVGPCQAGPSSAPRGNVDPVGDGMAPQTVDQAVSLYGVIAQCLTPLRDSTQTVIGWKVGDAPFEVMFQVNVPSGYCVDYRTSQQDGRGFTGPVVSSSIADWSRSHAQTAGYFQGSEVTLYPEDCDMTIFGQQVSASSAETANPAEQPAPNTRQQAPAATATPAPASTECPEFSGIASVPGNDGSPFCKIPWDQSRGVVTVTVPEGWTAETDTVGMLTSGQTGEFGSATFRRVDAQ